MTLGGEFQTRHFGHLDVGQEHVRAFAANQSQCFGSVPRLRDDAEVALEL